MTNIRSSPSEYWNFTSLSWISRSDSGSLTKMNGIPIGYLINKMCKLFFSALQNIGKSNIFVNNKGYVAMVLAVSGWLKLCQLVEIFCRSSFREPSSGA